MWFQMNLQDQCRWIIHKVEGSKEWLKTALKSQRLRHQLWKEHRWVVKELSSNLSIQRRQVLFCLKVYVIVIKGPKNTNQEERKNVQAEARKLLESLKARQNNEMLTLLEEEQNKENAREAKLQSTTNPKEREKMEKMFSMERAKAHARIQQLAE